MDASHSLLPDNEDNIVFRKRGSFHNFTINTMHFYIIPTAMLFPFPNGASRAFSSTSSSNPKDAGPLYSIAGALLSVADIRGTKPESRTVAHWRVLVDWDLQSTRPYVVVDPFDPRGLLYLTRGEYLLQSRVSLANDLTFIVIARPGDVAPVPSSKNSPSSLSRDSLSSSQYFSNKSNRLTWKDFLRLRRFASMNVKVVEGMVSVHSKNIERAALVWGRQLLHYSGVTAPERRLSGFRFLTGHLRTILTCNGTEHLVKRLKVNLFALYSYLSGNPLRTTQDLGFRVRLANGLPVFIPADIRKRIREGDLVWIRIWASLLNIYRAFKVRTPDPETAYSTIRKPLPCWYPGDTLLQFDYFARYVFPELLKSQASRHGVSLPYFSYKSALGYIVRSAAANLRGSSSIFSIILDAQAWAKRPVNHVLNWFAEFGDHTAMALFNAIRQETHFDPDMFDEQQDFSVPPFKTKEEEKAWRASWDEKIAKMQSTGSLSAYIRDAWKLTFEAWKTRITGRLFNFDAPGGKLRTVAICDYWTQIAMKPVHDYLFDILKILRCNDATFDQQGTVDAYHARNLKPHWSFDLSAATDSIPITLYEYVLAPLFMDESGDYAKAHGRAKLWSKLMVDRDFSIPSPRKGEKFHRKDGLLQFRTIRYGTGQPMGALSSWASMALVHHALVQFAHWKTLQSDAANTPWFDTYIVLGDDIDIAENNAVSENYQKACADFSIKIGLAKSLKSDSNFFEFANQRFSADGNISPISFGEEVSAQSWASRVEFASRIASRFGVRMGPSALLRLALTARQWQALIPELSGIRDAIFTRFIRFLLLNPLVPLWHSKVDINIDTIRAWLGDLEKGLLEPALLSADDKRRIDLILCNSIAARIDTVLKHMSDKLAQCSSVVAPPPVMMGSMPPPPKAFSAIASVHLLSLHSSMMGHYSIESQHSENFLTALGRLDLSTNEVHLIRTFLTMFDTASIRAPKLAPVSYAYIFAAATMQNKEIQEQVSEMTSRLFKLKKEIYDRDVPMQLFGLLVKDKPSPLAELVRLYLDASGLPQVIRLDLDGITQSSIGVKRSQMKPQDVACELVNTIVPTLAQWTGFAIHKLPVLPPKGGNMQPKLLTRLTKFYKKVVEERSKVKHGVSLNLLNGFNPLNGLKRNATPLQNAFENS